VISGTVGPLSSSQDTVDKSRKIMLTRTKRLRIIASLKCQLLAFAARQNEAPPSANLKIVSLK